MVRTMTAPFERRQIQRIVTSLPAIKCLAANAEVATSEGHVLAVAVEIHPAQANPRFPAEFHPDSGQPARSRRFSIANLHADTLLEVSTIILNENMDALLGFLMGMR